MIILINKNKDDCPDKFQDEKGNFYTFEEIIDLLKNKKIDFETKKGGEIIFVEDKNKCNGKGFLATMKNGVRFDNLDEIKTESFTHFYKELTK